MEKFISGVDAFSDALGKVLAWLLVPMVLIVLYTAFMRYFLQAPVPWGFEMALFAFGIHGIGGGAYCLRHGGHVSVDVVASQLPPRWAAVLNILGSLVVVLVTVVMVYLGSRWAWKSTLILERSIHGTEFNPQIWWFKWMVPIAAGLVLLQAVAQLLKNMLQLRKAGE